MRKWIRTEIPAGLYLRNSGASTMSLTAPRCPYKLPLQALSGEFAAVCQEFGPRPRRFLEHIPPADTPDPIVFCSS